MAWGQSGIVVKGGVMWNDYLRDKQSIFSKSQAGHVVGLEIRLGAEDNTYFKPAAYYGKMHMRSQDHPEETQFFNVEDGYEFFKVLCGIEGRMVTLRHFNWRFGISGAFNYVANVTGNVRFEDIHNAFFGLNVSSGIDIYFVTLDLSIDRGFSNFSQNQENSKPFMMMLMAGFRF